MKYVLDTHMLIWWVSGSGKLGKKAKHAIASAAEGQPLVVSDISLWEIALLIQSKRIEIGRSLRDWLEAATAAPLVEVQQITAAVAADMLTISREVIRDPADRCIIATARVLGATLVTADRIIIGSKLVNTVS